jgi:co-chaperonin GroES (HSP10)
MTATRERARGVAQDPTSLRSNHVLFAKWSGTEVLIDGEDRLIMKEADFFGVIDRRSPGAKAA